MACRKRADFVAKVAEVDQGNDDGFNFIERGWLLVFEVAISSVIRLHEG
jgi:hypothetical protein